MIPLIGPAPAGAWKELTADEIDDLVHEWHSLPPGATETLARYEGADYTLADYLGMTFTEYGKWLIG
ncbi:hypothetical protein HOT75_gp061 [Gordonia phage Daredevil]|uniref:Uncharacterized protein n=1 Tax=Gordonia phage Daredevil TaxID=2283286 RepID=A0A345MIR7_9CAUD|nr:hypothetical protein HOT75_gp061 [Gordonia phage Daredevil]AXH70448.1 hypothetical protein SEA_DAREDEVIL_61 [Gordonia phage Daredevil]